MCPQWVYGKGMFGLYQGNVKAVVKAGKLKLVDLIVAMQICISVYGSYS